MRCTFTAFCGSFLALANCANPEPGEDPCIAIAREYQAAIPDAMICDPAQPDSCAAGRPLVVSQVNEDGSWTLEGLCDCQHTVNPARTQAVDEILARFFRAGCTLKSCPCLPPESTPPRCPETGVCAGAFAP
jgi:hypothetical protein